VRWVRSPIHLSTSRDAPGIVGCEAKTGAFRPSLLWTDPVSVGVSVGCRVGELADSCGDTPGMLRGVAGRGSGAVMYSLVSATQPD